MQRVTCKHVNTWNFTQRSQSKTSRKEQTSTKTGKTDKKNASLHTWVKIKLAFGQSHVWVLWCPATVQNPACRHTGNTKLPTRCEWALECSTVMDGFPTRQSRSELATSFDTSDDRWWLEMWVTKFRKVQTSKIIQKNLWTWCSNYNWEWRQYSACDQKAPLTLTIWHLYTLTKFIFKCQNVLF